MSARIRRPSPAMVVACTALAISLGGVSYAATSLPRNSVGSAQLKPNAVNSAKVANGSLLRVDFKKGQLSAGSAGGAGPAGPKGDTGPKGEKGDPGPSSGYADLSAGPATVPTSAYARIATLRLPDAGKYLVWSKTHIQPAGSSLAAEYVCKLDAGAEEDVTLTSAPANLMATVTNILSLDITDATTVNLNCRGSAPAAFAYESRIAAIKVADLATSSG